MFSGTEEGKRVLRGGSHSIGRKIFWVLHVTVGKGGDAISGLGGEREGQFRKRRGGAKEGGSCPIG